MNWGLKGNEFRRKVKGLLKIKVLKMGFLIEEVRREYILWLFLSAGETKTINFEHELFILIVTQVIASNYGLDISIFNGDRNNFISFTSSAFPEYFPSFFSWSSRRFPLVVPKQVPYRYSCLRTLTRQRSFSCCILGLELSERYKC